MSKRLFPTVALCAAVLSCAPSPAASSQSATYVAIVGVSVQDTAFNFHSDMADNTGFGGYTFAAVNTVPRSITIEDAAQGKSGIGFTVCQLIDTSSSCGDAGSVEKSFCSADAVSLLNRGFVANKPITVTINTVDDRCAGVATEGAIQISF